MSSRKEQKEQLRAERERREQEAKASEKRRRMIGIGAAGALVVAAIVVGVVVIALSGGDDGGSDSKAAADPSSADADFVKAPIPPKGEASVLEDAAKAADCTLKTWPNEGANHTNPPYTYKTNPPTSGDHFIQPAADGAYAKAPEIGQLVHELEHGRIVLWFQPTASEQLKGQMKTLFDEDPFHMVLAPNETKMPYEVAASAWTHSLTCETVNDQTWDALRLFRDRYRDQGPEKVP